METRPGGFKFFFANAAIQFDSLLRFARSKFTNLFGSGKRIEHNTYARGIKTLIAEGHDNRYVELIWLAGDDPLKIETMERMPIIDYWNLLNRKYAANERAAIQLAKLNGRKR